MKKIRIKTSYKFLLVMGAVYLLLAVFNFGYFKIALSSFFSMLERIVPVMFLVFGVMVLVNLFFTEKRMRKHLGEGSGVKGWLYVIFTGIIISGPPYVLYPLLGELKEKGMKDSLLAVFLFNRNVKIPFIPVMIFYFGWGFAVVLSLYIVLFSVLNGLLVGALVKKRG